MKANWEKLENNQGVLTIEVEQDQVQNAVDLAFKKVVKQVNLPGFRKGKVPRKIFESRLVLNHCIKMHLKFFSLKFMDKL